MTGTMQNMLGLGKVAAGSPTVNISPAATATSLANGFAFSQNYTASVTGVTSPTYAWSWLSGGAGFTLSGATTAVCTVNGSGATNTTRTGVLGCTVSGTGGPVSDSANIEVAWGTGV